MPKEYRVNSILELNTIDDYVLNTDVETYTSSGKFSIKKGSSVKFLSVIGSAGMILFKNKDGYVETCHFSLLSGVYETLVGKIVKIPSGITLSTHDGNFFFDNGMYVVEAVYMDKSKNLGMEEKMCFVRYIGDDHRTTEERSSNVFDVSKLTSSSAVTGVVSAYLVEKI